jgi:ASC-1-like (ASCH) protein
MHELGIESSLVEAIRTGDKTVEGRLGKPRFLDIKPGDTLMVREDIWDNGTLIGSYDDSLRAQVTQVLYFETFKEMLEAVNYEAAVPTANSLDEAVAKYREFYTEKDEEEYGVVALLIKVS